VPNLYALANFNVTAVMASITSSDFNEKPCRGDIRRVFVLYVHTFANILDALNMREKKIPRGLRIRNSYEKIIR